MKNLEKLYSDLLGNPTKGNLTELDKKYSAKLGELSNSKENDKVDISRIQKCGELQNAYLYLKTQWTIKEQHRSGLITNQNLPNYQRSRRTEPKKTSAIEKIHKINVELRRTAKAGLILVSILSCYQLINYIINQEKVVASTDIINSPEAWNKLVNEETKMRSDARKELKQKMPGNLEALTNDINDRGPDPELIAASKICNLGLMKSAHLNSPNINVKNNLGETPAHWLSKLNCSEGLKWAINNGADMHVRDNSGRTAIDWAKLNNSYESIQVINQQSMSRK